MLHYSLNNPISLPVQNIFSGEGARQENRQFPRLEREKSMGALAHALCRRYIFIPTNFCQPKNHRQTGRRGRCPGAVHPHRR
jgi:hypothetical protein